MRTWLVIAFALVALCSCRPEDNDDRPRLVLLYAPCTVSKTFLSPYSPEVSFTPNLSAFAKEGVTFRRHQTEAASSGIAYASIFSGAQVNRHGAYRHPTILSPKLQLIGEIYGDAGYDTFFWNGHTMTATGLGYDQGVPPRNRVVGVLRANDPKFQSILRRLQAEPTYRALVITDFTLTHGPYKQKFLQRFLHEHPDRAGGLREIDIARFAKIYAANHFPLAWNHEDTVLRLGLSKGELRALTKVAQLFYESSVAELDRIFGATLDEIRRRGLHDESLIAFTADHGEVLYRPSAPFKWSHSMQLAPEVLGVPWIVRSNDPAVRPGAYEGVTRSIDVLPTLLGLGRIPVPEASQIEGHDLSDVLRGIGQAPSLEAYSHTTLLVRRVFEQMYDPATARDWATAKRFFPDESAEHIWVALRRGDELYKRRKLDGTHWKTELFDLATDPWAEEDIYDPTDPQMREATNRLEAYRARIVDSYERDQDAEQRRRLPDEEEAEKLKGLGYIQ